jgi:hypothetical protein
MNLDKEFYSKLPYDKIKMNWNKNPIKVETLLSFLTVPVEISRDHLGASTGWTRKFNDEHKLYIRGGIVGGVDYLDGIEYGVKLQNPYNNYVNPFYLMPIMNKDGFKFFLEYYKNEIDEITENLKASSEWHKEKSIEEDKLYNEIIQEIQSLKS